MLRNVISALLATPKAPKPIYMQIEPTNRCNLKCVMCAREVYVTEPNDLSYEDFVKILDQLDGLRYLVLSGYGEPFLNKELIEMIKYAKDKRIDVETFINMTIISKSLAKEIVSSGLDRIYASIDSADPEKYRQIRGAA